MNPFDLLPRELLGKEGVVSLDTLKENDVIGLYFSAHWCGPCRAFTPILADSYTKMKAAGKKIEIVFISSDQNFDQFFEYFQTMPWISVDFEGECRETVGEVYNVSGIPTLLIFDKNGNMIDQNARGTVTQYRENSFEQWVK